MYTLLAQQTLTRAVEVFLKEHNVDLGQFNEQVKIIFDNSIKVGDISNSTGVTIGDNSSTKVEWFLRRSEMKDRDEGRQARTIKVGDVQGTGIVIGDGSSASINLPQSSVQRDTDRDARTSLIRLLETHQSFSC